MESPSNLFVVCLGVGTVFVGLICIILLCKIISLLCGIADNKATEPSAVAPAAVQAPSIGTPIVNRQEIIAAVSAAVSEELGTDISAIRILSFKKI